jgi:penicillin amidase
VPFREKPKRFNPPEGFVASANNRVVDDTFPHVITRWGFAVSYRIDRINELLESNDTITVEKMKEFHRDTFTHLYGDMKPAIRVLDENRDQLNSRENKALDILMAWDGRMDIDSGAAAILDSFYLSLARGIFYDEMGKDLFKRFFSSKMISQQAFRQVLEDPDNPWYDLNETERKEGFRDVVLAAFRDAVGVLRVEIGRDPSKWTWGEVHSITLKHPLGRMWVVDAVFKLNSGPYPVPGSFHTIPQFMYRQTDPFEVVHGPSQRHIYTPADWDLSRSMIPTGTSGIPGSPYYCDQAPGFMKGEYHDDPFSQEAVEKAARHSLILRPQE